MDARRGVPLELNRIGDQVLEDLQKLRRIGSDGGQIIVGDEGPALLNGGLQVQNRLAEDRVRVGRLERLAPGTYPGIGQQVVDEPLHTHRAVHRIIDIFFGLRVELPLVALGQKLGVAGDHPQRLLQVV